MTTPPHPSAAAPAHWKPLSDRIAAAPGSMFAGPPAWGLAPHTLRSMARESALPAFGGIAALTPAVALFFAAYATFVLARNGVTTVGVFYAAVAVLMLSINVAWVVSRSMARRALAPLDLDLVVEITDPTERLTRLDASLPTGDQGEDAVILEDLWTSARADG